MPRYLQKKRRRWYATLEVPKKIQAKLNGKRRLVRSLETESLTVAEQRVWAVIAKWKEFFERLESGHLGGDTLKAVELEAQSLQSKGWQASEIRDYQETVADTFDDLELKEAVAVLHGRIIRTERNISEYLDAQEIAAKTKDMRRADLKTFAKKFPYPDEVTRNAVSDWVESDLMQARRLSPSTCRRIISACRGYWKFLIKRKIIDLPSPFDDVVPKDSQKRRVERGVERRKGFAVADYQMLLKGARRRSQSLSDLIQLAAYTGARIEELCSLKLNKVEHDRLNIEDAKTEAGWRSIPIHPHVADLVASLKDKSTDGYLISGLTFNKYGDRSNAIGKQFGRLKRDHGYGPAYVFHSFRKGVATQLESAKIPENIAARLLGHEFRTMSYGLYSGGVSFEVLTDALDKIDWT